MRKYWILGAVLATGLLVGSPFNAVYSDHKPGHDKGGPPGDGGGGGGSCSPGSPIADPIPVTITFRNDEVSDHICSDADETVDCMSGTEEQDGVIDCRGEIVGGEYGNTKKTANNPVLFLDFSAPANVPPCESDCKRNFIETSTPVVLQTDVLPNPGDPTNDDGTLNGGAWAIPTMESRDSRFRVDFPGDGFGFRLRFDDRVELAPGATVVTMTRTASDRWTIEATTGSDIANLFAGALRNLAPTDEGNYHMPFQATVVCANAGDCP